MTVDLNAVAVIGAAMTATGLFLLLYAARKGMNMTHAQNPEVVHDGEVNVDVCYHEVVRHNSDGSRDVIDRTRTTPTRHDGTQKKRS